MAEQDLNERIDCDRAAHDLSVLNFLCQSNDHLEATDERDVHQEPTVNHESSRVPQRRSDEETRLNKIRAIERRQMSLKRQIEEKKQWAIQRRMRLQRERTTNGTTNSSTINVMGPIVRGGAVGRGAVGRGTVGRGAMGTGAMGTGAMGRGVMGRIEVPGRGGRGTGATGSGTAGVRGTMGRGIEREIGRGGENVVQQAEREVRGDITLPQRGEKRPIEQLENQMLSDLLRREEMRLVIEAKR